MNVLIKDKTSFDIEMTTKGVTTEADSVTFFISLNQNEQAILSGSLRLLANNMRGELVSARELTSLLTKEGRLEEPTVVDVLEMLAFIKWLE